jgi:hypothetical protein
MAIYSLTYSLLVFKVLKNPQIEDNVNVSFNIYLMILQEDN